MKTIHITVILGLFSIAGLLGFALQHDVASSSKQEPASVATASGVAEGTTPAPQETGGGDFSEASEQEAPSVEIYPEQQPQSMHEPEGSCS